MRFFLVLLLLPCFCGAIDILPSELPIPLPHFPIPDSLDALTPEKIADLFQLFIKNFEKVYPDQASEDKAIASFTQTLKDVIQLNIDNLLNEVKFGINQYSDLTDDEFNQKVLMQNPIKLEAPVNQNNEEQPSIVRRKRAVPPVSWDWRNHKNVVSGVKNQGSCGDCWAFATAALVTGAYGIKYNQLVEPSEQQIADCTDENYPACNGGVIAYGLQYVIKNGVSSESGYHAYDQTRATKNGNCEAKGKANDIQIRHYKMIYPSNATAIRDNLPQAPIGVLYQVGQSFRHYTSGIYQTDDCSQKGAKVGWHAVTVVGYGVEKNVPYWIVKNSWGAKWGEQGYFRFLRGKDLCQLESANTFYAIA